MTRGQRGFTLIELMISLVMFSLAMAGIFSIAVTLSSGLRQQRQVVAIQDSARASIDVISDAVRGMSPGVASGDIQHVNTCATGAFSVTNSSTGPDEITVVFSSPGPATSTRSAYGTGTTSVVLTDVSQISVGATLLITDLTKGHLVTVTNIDASSGLTTLAAQSCATLALPSGGYAAGSLVIPVQRARFYIDTINGTPTLMMDPDAEGPAGAEPLAEGIEDLQIAVGIDTGAMDGNLVEVGAGANDDEWEYNVAGDAALSGRIRAVRLSVIARAAAELQGGTPSFLRPALEDHAGSSVADAFRRRVLSSTIELRNLEGSP
jgi:prepilin-type N-terminal cleavage/methylation domain-containing protein